MEGLSGPEGASPVSVGVGVAIAFVESGVVVAEACEVDGGTGGSVESAAACGVVTVAMMIAAMVIAAPNLRVPTRRRDEWVG